MGKLEMNVKELFDFINNHEGEFFIRVIITEEGEVCGETVEGSINSTGGRTTNYE